MHGARTTPEQPAMVEVTAAVAATAAGRDLMPLAASTACPSLFCMGQLPGSTAASAAGDRTAAAGTAVELCTATGLVTGRTGSDSCGSSLAATGVAGTDDTEPLR
jgi:hypothetical protein